MWVLESNAFPMDSVACPDRPARPRWGTCWGVGCSRSPGLPDGAAPTRVVREAGARQGGQGGSLRVEERGEAGLHPAPPRPPPPGLTPSERDRPHADSGVSGNDLPGPTTQPCLMVLLLLHSQRNECGAWTALSLPVPTPCYAA